jgi:hypothetical protein
MPATRLRRRYMALGDSTQTTPSSTGALVQVRQAVVATRRLSLFAFLVATLVAADASSKIAEIELGGFLERAHCLCLVEIIESDVALAELGADLEGEPALNRLASARVVERIALGDEECDIGADTLWLAYSTEIHSAHPQTGERALAFLVERGRLLTESVYGRSYWRLREIDGRPYVEVGWRNSFLLKALPLPSGYVAYLPIVVVFDELGVQHGAVPEDCVLGVNLPYSCIGLDWDPFPTRPPLEVPR